jgi:hypothetical protein
MDLKTTDVLPTEKVGHIQSAGCKSQQKSVIGAYKQLWTETRIGNMMMMSFICSFRNNNHKPWDEIADEEERLLASDQANWQVPDDDDVDKEQENDQVVDRDETDGEDLTLLQSIGLAKFCTF